MTRLLLAVLLASLAVGCGKRPATAPAPAPDEVPAPTIDEPAIPAGIRLAEAAGAKAIDKLPDHPLYLNVNSEGEVILNPNDHVIDSKGDKIAVLANPAQVGAYLKRRAKEDQFAGAAKAVPAPVGDTPDKIIAAFAAEPAPPPREVVRLTVRVTSDADGAIVKITLRGDGIAKELDLKADPEGYAKQLKKLAEQHKGKHLTLAFELDRELSFAHLTQLHDLAVRAGLKVVSWAPLDSKER